MSSPTVDVRDAAKGLRAVLLDKLAAGWRQVWVRAEVQEGAGVVDVYVESRSGEIRHVSSVPDLTMDVFKWAHSLPERAAQSGSRWSLCSAHCVADGDCSLKFDFDDVSDVTKTSQRRTAWERVTFGARAIAYDPF
jgi:hypothetical protein